MAAAPAPGARTGTYPSPVDALDAIAADGRRTAWLGRPLSDCPAALDDDERRAWRAGWRHGADQLKRNRAIYEAGVRAYGRGVPRRAA